MSIEGNHYHRFRSLTGRGRRIFALLTAFCVSLGTLSACGSGKATATSMRLQRLVGTVNIQDKKGKDVSIQEQMRLLAGHLITTAAESLVMVSLDDTKLLTLEENANATIESTGNKLKLNVSEGSFFFNVTEKLAEGETFEIETSNMICGIRGTSAYKGKDAEGHDIFMTTDGTVSIIATNPDTGESIETIADAKTIVTIYMNAEASSGTISVSRRIFREEDLFALVLDSLVKDPDLMDRVVKTNGFSEKKLRALAKLSTRPATTMYGTAAAELHDEGIDDAMPLMGIPAIEMTDSANFAADLAGDDFDTEIAILTGLHDVLFLSMDAEYSDEDMSTLMEGARTSMKKVVDAAKEKGLTGQDLLDEINKASEELTEAVKNAQNVNDAVSGMDEVADELADELKAETDTEPSSEPEPEPVTDPEPDPNTQTDTTTQTTTGTSSSRTQETTEPATETPAAETPAAETPATEAPATETPATETPATETPAAETPAQENTTDTPAENTTDNTKQEEEQQTEPEEDEEPEPEPVTYTVTVEPVENVSLSVDKETASEGDTITVTATPSDGYEVTEVIAGGTAAAKATDTTYTFTMPASNVRVSATVTELEPEETVTVNLNPQGGTLEQEVAYPGDPLPIDVQREGFTFTGWYTAAEGGTQVETVPEDVETGTTYYAQYTRNSYRVEFGELSPAGAGSIAYTDMGKYQYEYEEQVSLTLNCTEDYIVKEKDISITGSNGGNVTTFELTGGDIDQSTGERAYTLTFAMPADEVTVDATFRNKNGRFTLDDWDTDPAVTVDGQPVTLNSGEYVVSEDSTVRLLIDNDGIQFDELRIYEDEATTPTTTVSRETTGANYIDLNDADRPGEIAFVRIETGTTYRIEADFGYHVTSLTVNEVLDYNVEEPARESINLKKGEYTIFKASYSPSVAEAEISWTPSVDGIISMEETTDGMMVTGSDVGTTTLTIKAEDVEKIITIKVYEVTSNLTLTPGNNMVYNSTGAEAILNYSIDPSDLGVTTVADYSDGWLEYSITGYTVAADKIFAVDTGTDTSYYAAPGMSSFTESGYFTEGSMTLSVKELSSLTLIRSEQYSIEMAEGSAATPAVYLQSGSVVESVDISYDTQYFYVTLPEGSAENLSVNIGIQDIIAMERLGGGVYRTSRTSVAINNVPILVSE